MYFSRMGMNYSAGEIVNLPEGNSKVAAQYVNDILDADIFEIKPVKAYSSDYNQCTVEAKEELMNNERPQIEGFPENVDLYDSMILCYPNWWGTVPMVVKTFLEGIETEDLKIYPICTNEGSGLGTSEKDIADLCPNAKVMQGLSIRGSSVSKSMIIINNWLKKSELI